MEAKDRIRTDLRVWDIPRSTVAKLCGIHRPDFSAWLNNRQELSAAKVQRIVEVVGAIRKATSLYSIRFDLRNPDNVKALIQAVETAEVTVGYEDLEQVRTKISALLAGVGSFSSLSEQASPEPDA